MCKLNQVSDDIKKEDHVKEVYVFFNNDSHLHAIENALQMEQLVTGVKKTSNTEFKIF